MALVDVRMPADENEGTEAALGRWLKQAGEAVSEHEPIVEINTDKVTLEIPAPAAGRLQTFAKQPGDAVRANDLLATIERASVEPDLAGAELAGKNGAAASMARTDTSSPRADGAATRGSMLEHVRAGAAEGLSPATRRLLAELKLDASQVPKSTRGGRLTPADIAAFVGTAVARSAPTPPSPKNTAMTGRLVPHTPMRRSIATHMAHSMSTAPHVTAVFEADLSGVLADRDRRKQNGAEAPSVTAYLLQAAVVAVRAVPEVNSRWHDEHLEIFDTVHFGVATALESGGLVVPVIRNTEALDLDGLSSALRSMTAKARAGKLTQAELEGGTLTLSNHGVGGSLLATPIVLPHGQAAILGAGKLQKRVVVCDNGGRDLFRVRPMMYVTLTIDHRVLDGQHANAYMTAFVAALEKT